MRIEASSITIAASHSAEQRVAVRESLRAWVGNRRPGVEGREAAGGNGERVDFSPQALLAELSDWAQLQQEAAAPPAEAAAPVEDAEAIAEHSPGIRLLKLIIEALTGRSVDTLTPDDIRALREQAAARGHHAEAPPRRAGWGIEYDRREIRAESEATRVAAQGVVRTSDGREIRFSMALDMQRSHYEESRVSLLAGDGVRKDPLVINFGGPAAQLQEMRFAFDLDGDGDKENVPMLSGGSGYLALDLDGNGAIDSGRELFGASSGDGFADLAQYDSDGNGWIDENDPVFGRLRIWTPTADGKGGLATLARHDVGALYLGKASSPFELRDAANGGLGAVRSTGLFLREDGSAGTLQQIDLIV